MQENIQINIITEQPLEIAQRESTEVGALGNTGGNFSFKYFGVLFMIYVCAWLYQQTSRLEGAGSVPSSCQARNIIILEITATHLSEIMTYRKVGKRVSICTTPIKSGPVVA